MEDSGYFKITGRIKELIITEGGKNIAPIPIESRIKEELSSIISQAMVIGDNQKFLSCLLTLKVEVDTQTLIPTDNLDPGVREWCKNVLRENGLQNDLNIPKTIADVTNGPHASFFTHYIQQAIDNVNQRADFRAAEVRKFCILPNEFSVTGGEYGPTLKLKRHVIVSKYQHEINKMYV